MPQADEFTQILQPRQHAVFQRVGERNGVFRMAGLIHVPDNGGNLFQLPLAELDERRAIIKWLANVFRQQAQGNHRLFENRGQIPPDFARHLTVIDENQGEGGFNTLPGVVGLLIRLLEQQQGRFFQSNCPGLDPAKKPLIQQWQGKIHRLAVNVQRAQNALSFQGERFEMAANGIQRAVPGRQSHRQTIKRYFNLITSFRGIK